MCVCVCVSYFVCWFDACLYFYIADVQLVDTFNLISHKFTTTQRNQNEEEKKKQRLVCHSIGHTFMFIRNEIISQNIFIGRFYPNSSRFHISWANIIRVYVCCRWSSVFLFSIKSHFIALCVAWLSETKRKSPIQTTENSL